MCTEELGVPKTGWRSVLHQTDDFRWNAKMTTRKIKTYVSQLHCNIRLFQNDITILREKQNRIGRSVKIKSKNEDNFPKGKKT